MTPKTNILQVLKNKAERAKASLIIDSKGKEFYEYRGDRIKPEHFEMMLPTKLQTIKTFIQ